MSKKNDQLLGTGTKLVYGSGEFFNGTATVIILMLYLKFLTDVVGIPPFWAGICVVSGKLWDAISDPLIGAISDRTKSRWGRRRVYFLIFCVPASFSFASMWLFIHSDHLWVKVTYYAVAYVAFKTLSSLLNVPYQALGPELTSDYDERTSLITFRMAFSLAGAIMAGVLPGILINRLAQAGYVHSSHLIVSALFGIVYIGIWLIVFTKIRERFHGEVSQRVPLLQALRTTLRNRSFRILIGIYICAFLAIDILTASAKYYVDEFLQNPSMLPVIMGVMLTCGMFSLPLYHVLIKKFDRKASYIIGSMVWVVALAALFFITPGVPSAIIVVIMIVVGIGVACAFVVPWSALPEVIDCDIVVNGRKIEGVYTGIMTFLRKLTTTLAIFLIATSLDFTGYKSPETLGESIQDVHVLWVIRIFTTVVPAVILIVGIIIATRYPITKRFHSLLRRKLETDTGHPLSPEEEIQLNDLLSIGYGKQ